MHGSQMLAEMAEQPVRLRELIARFTDIADQVRSVAPDPLSGTVIAARLDAAFFVLPMLLVAPVSGAARLKATALIGACGLAYAVANQAIFGTWLPVSGSIKSLGGLQLNRAMLDAAEQAGRPNIIDFNFPELAAWQRAKAMLDDGCIGRLRHVVLTWNAESHAVRTSRTTRSRRLRVFSAAAFAR